MKILTGSLRGKKILFKPNPYLRPTADKVRKAIFDKLQGHLEGKRVLDLFSGTGALGFEALSNGADHVTFVEKNARQCQRIGDTLASLGLSGRASVLHHEAVAAVDLLSKKELLFDLVFLDPPYERGFGTAVLETLSLSVLLEPSALVVAETRKTDFLPEKVSRLLRINEKKYCEKMVSIYKVL